MKKQNAFILYAVLAAGLTLVFVSLANAIIDPFGVFRWMEIPGVNIHKPAINIEDSRNKLQAIGLIKPQSLVLGSSRTETGINPNSPYWLDAKLPTYNLSLVSGTMSVVNEYFLHANTIRPVKNVLLGVDLVMFKEYIRDKEVSSRINAHRRNIRTSDIEANLYYLLSLDALRASVKTVLQQSTPGNQDYLYNGQRSPLTFKNRQASLGHGKMFQTQEKKYIFQQRYTDSQRGRYVFNNSEQQSTNIKAFTNLVNACLANNTKLKIFINPVHARQQEIIYQENQWHTFETWKREMVRIIENANEHYSPAEPVQLWDFTGYNTVTMETVPGLGDTKTVMHWYWESSHYTAAVGDLILKRMYNIDSKDVPADFGIRLNSANIEQHLLDLRRSRENYAASNGDDVDTIRSLLKLREDKFRRYR
ncbi:MAG: hypothetical protein PVJ72_04175 [Gammaproteobacteria bacterium]|jgi:hypothetical protein